jgi:hypothetical protein
MQFQPFKARCERSANSVNKFHAIKIEIDGRVFASRAEGRRYSELCLLEQAGEISYLECQPVYQIFVNKKHICNYIADFRYQTKDGNLVVEDVKGLKTPVYRLKKKLVEARFGIEIMETT